MKLDRNVNTNGRGKYAVINLRKLPDDPGKRADCEHAMRILEDNGCLFNESVGGEFEHFTLMLKDKYAPHALEAYAKAARADGEREYATAVQALAARSGVGHPNCKRPD
jgi:hypothetical protein